MSMKHYGIYVAYPPTVDMRAEGLGRYLVALLKGAEARDDIRFLVACPSWSKDILLELCKSEGVDINRFDIISVGRKPLMIKILERCQALMAWLQRRGLYERLIRKINSYTSIYRRWLEMKVDISRLSLLLLPLLIFYIPILAIDVFLSCVQKSESVLKKLLSRSGIKRHSFLSNLKSTLIALIPSPKDIAILRRLYYLMEKHQTESLSKKINQLTHVLAWYTPSAFCPAFNLIKTPRLLCVPDVVLMDFPVGFAMGGYRFQVNFQKVMATIRGSDHFVVYSEQIKWGTLVDRCAVPADKVHIVHHAPNRLDQWLQVSGYADAAVAKKNYTQKLLSAALLKATHPGYSFDNSSVRFIFYASQFRPNKNIFSLLRAYEYLLHKRFIQHKLILTGNPKAMSGVLEFVREHHLENDVLFLRGLSIAELAACYHLADLAVNPSLSEGGCPFTFTEALSVNTPVVMARIPVTMEILHDASLDEVMFFDPYNWNDMAERIAWAIHHRDRLLEIQKPIYERLTQRTWSDVVGETISLLEHISSPVDQQAENLAGSDIELINRCGNE